MEDGVIKPVVRHHSERGRHGALTEVARELGIGIESVFSSVPLRSDIGRHPGAGPAVWRPGLLAEACRRFGLSLWRQLEELVVRTGCGAMSTGS